MPHVYVSKFEKDSHIGLDIEKALDWLDVDRFISTDTTVFLKPNLTWSVYKPGITVRPEFIESLVAVLSRKAKRVIVGESDGGYHLFGADEAFENFGLMDLVKKYPGVEVVNLSKLPSEQVSVSVGQNEFGLELPSLLLHDIDVFITVPVPKVHSMTLVTLGFKNQWGCLPSTMRMKNHADFAPKIVAINKLLKPVLAIFDGEYFLNRNGPMAGEPVHMGLLIASDNIGAGSLACCEIMGINSDRVKHFRLARAEGLMPNGLAEVTCNVPLNQFKKRDFCIERTLMNWVGLASFKSSFIQKITHDSIWGNWLHAILYRIRRNSLISRMLYGEFGFVEGNKSRSR